MQSGRKHQVIAAGFAILRATRLHRALAPLTQGVGAILMAHHVRPWQPRVFAPNRLLEITPGFLDAALTLVRSRGIDVVTLDDALLRLGDPKARRFAVVTLDDGYRDNFEHALPIFERHGVPFTINVTPGFAGRTARLWWVELEDAIAALDAVEITLNGEEFRLPAVSAEDKQTAFETLYWRLRAGPEDQLLAAIAALLVKAGLSSEAIVDRLCLDWAGLEALARHPLCTLGVHTMTHPMLAKHRADAVRDELARSRAVIEGHTGKPARHLAYPIGDPGSAGAREFGIAKELGFASAVTTRPGVLFPAHKDHPLALPRVSLNGHYQSTSYLDILLSGVPFALWNKGRLLNVA